MAYTLIGWLNDQAPAINKTNLNKMDNELLALDNQIDNLRNNYAFTPILTVDSFTFGRGMSNTGVLNYNVRACVTLSPFDAKNVSSIKWTGADRTESSYHVFICWYSDIDGTSFIERDKLFDNHIRYTVDKPTNAKSARIVFQYYSTDNVDEITQALFVPYFGIEISTYTDERIDNLEEGSVLNIAHEFDENFQYYVGDIVKKDEKTYVFQNDHIGAWASGDVKEAPIGEYLTGVQKAHKNTDILLHNGILELDEITNGAKAIGNPFVVPISSTYSKRCCTSTVFLSAGDTVYLGGDFSGGLQGNISSKDYSSGYKSSMFSVIVTEPGYYFVNFRKIVSNEEVDIEPDDITLTVTVVRLTADETMKELCDAVENQIDGNNVIFVHVTDTHVGNSKMPRDRAVRHFAKVLQLSKCVKADFVIHTGDAIQGFDLATSGSEQIDRDNYKSYLSAIEDLTIPFHWCQGNPWHDFGHRIYEGSNKEFTLTRDIVLNYIGRYGKWHDKKYNESDSVRSYYYFDINEQKIRVIVLDSDDYTQGEAIRMNNGFSSEQIEWFVSVLDDAESKGLPVVVFTHMAPLSELHPGGSGIESKGGGLIAQAMVDFQTNGGVLIECVCGHGHFDWIKEINGINYVFLACDLPSSYSPSAIPVGAESPSRVIGQLSEYCYDVHVVNPSTHKVDIYRYGAGNTTNVFPTRYINTET